MHTPHAMFLFGIQHLYLVLAACRVFPLHPAHLFSVWPHAILDTVQIIFGALSLLGVSTSCPRFCTVRAPPVRDNVSMFD